MAVLNRMDWYDLARSTNWTPKYVTEDELFPPQLSGEPMSAPKPNGGKRSAAGTPRAPWS